MAKKEQRIVKVSGYLVFKETDPGFHWGLDTIADSLTGIADLALTELPNARKTKKGIRTDGGK
jgi:hypothetical protein